MQQGSNFEIESCRFLFPVFLSAIRGQGGREHREMKKEGCILASLSQKLSVDSPIEACESEW